MFIHIFHKKLVGKTVNKDGLKISYPQFIHNGLFISRFGQFFNNFFTTVLKVYPQPRWITFLPCRMGKNAVPDGEVVVWNCNVRLKINLRSNDKDRLTLMHKICSMYC